MTVKLEDLAPGDTVQAYVCTFTSYNSERYSPILGTVQRVNRKTVSVVWQHSGRFQRVDPNNLDKVTWQTE